MCKRALFIVDWPRLTEAGFQSIRQRSAGLDECIFLIDRDNIRSSFPDDPGASQLMTALHSLFTSRLSKPFYLFPHTGHSSSTLHYWLRARILCPEFQIVYTDRQDRQHVMQTALKTPVETIGCPAANDDAAPILKPTHPTRRGLFITRAQPFHLGHAAFLEQMGAEQAECIILIAMANRSHLPSDVATAGERMQMIQPWLEKQLPGRYYLAPLPYSDFIMENIYELEFILPAFQTIYTVNRTVEAMAATAGYETRSLDQRIDISSTMIRQAVLEDRPYRHLMPEAVYQHWERLDLPQRLKHIHLNESR